MNFEKMARYKERFYKRLEPGDIVVFMESPSTPLSHIAIFDHDVNGVSGAFLGQKQGAAAGAFNVVNLPYDATYPTAFRLKAKAQPKPEEKEPDKKLEKGSDASIYRLYNPNSGDYLYTQSFDEAKAAISHAWSYEGIAWIPPAKGKPVEHLYNPQSGLHHYTVDETEANRLKKAGWKTEGTAFYSSGNRSISRMYNPNNGAHLLSAKRSEHDGLCKAGWICEGTDIKWICEGTDIKWICEGTDIKY